MNKFWFSLGPPLVEWDGICGWATAGYSFTSLHWHGFSVMSGMGDKFKFCFLELSGIFFSEYFQSAVS